MVSAGSYAKLSDQQRQPYQDLLSRLIVLVGRPDERIDQRERMLMHRTLLNLWDFQHAYSITLETIRAGGEAGNRRDVSMGNNLAWLAYQYHPDRKIVAWAANTHLARDIAALEGFGNFRDMFDTYRPMGQVALELMGDDIYSIGVLAYSGRSRRVNRDFAIPVKAMPGSLEELLHLTGHKYLFIDLKHTPQDHWLRQELVAGAFGYSPMRGDWSAVFDAFIFIDEMLPATPVRRSSPSP